MMRTRGHVYDPSSGRFLWDADLDIAEDGSGLGRVNGGPLEPIHVHHDGGPVADHVRQDAEGIHHAGGIATDITGLDAIRAARGLDRIRALGQALDKLPELRQKIEQSRAERRQIAGEIRELLAAEGITEESE